MKKQILGILLGSAFLIAGAVSFIPNSDAEMQSDGADYWNACAGQCDPPPYDCLPEVAL